MTVGADNTRSRVHRIRNCFLSGCGAVLAAYLWAVESAVPATASAPSLDPRSTYGEIGLLDMPSARMAPDGELSLTVSALDNTQRYNLGFQILPWLEGSFRYSHIRNVRGLPDLYDRSFGLKMRLIKESDFWPEVSFGMRDIVGTGVYGAEYFAASKRFGSVDFTMGMGWGRLASAGTLPNPLAQISSSFGTRTTFTGGAGGTPNFGEFLHGPDVGIFGGIDWRTPIRNLNFIVEYSSDRYLEEKTGGSLNQRMPVNIGLSYRPFTGMKVSAGWYYGTTYGLSLSFDVDPTTSSAITRVGPDVPEPVIRSDAQQSRALTTLLRNARPGRPGEPIAPFVRLTEGQRANLNLNEVLFRVGNMREYEIVGRTVMINAPDFVAAKVRCSQYAQAIAGIRSDIDTVAVTSFESADGDVAFCPVTRGVGLSPIASLGVNSGGLTANQLTNLLRRDMNAQNLRLIAVYLNGSGLTIYYENNRYFSDAEAAGRIARVLMMDAPPDVEIFHLIPVRNNMAASEIRIARSSLERGIAAYADVSELGSAVSVVSAPLNNPAFAAARRNWSPQFRWSLSPSLRQVFFDPNTPLQLQVYALGEASLEVLPGLTLYGAGEANLFNNFDTRNPSNSVLPHVRSDVNEYFKHGVNGIRELSLTYDARLGQNLFGEIRAGYLETMYAGVGGQILWRPDNGRWAFGLDAYQVWQRKFDRLFGLQSYKTVTGHASVYYQSPWYGLNFALHAGRYLAKDYGATFEVTRRFSTGVEIGAFATLTDVPFSKFGEGSFDKGLIIRIPLQWALPSYTRSEYSLALRSITRDGGARLDGDDSLYRKMIATSSAEIGSHLDEIVDPSN